MGTVQFNQAMQASELQQPQLASQPEQAQQAHDEEPLLPSSKKTDGGLSMGFNINGGISLGATETNKQAPTFALTSEEPLAETAPGTSKKKVVYLKRKAVKASATEPTDSAYRYNFNGTVYHSKQEVQEAAALWSRSIQDNQSGVISRTLNNGPNLPGMGNLMEKHNIAKKEQALQEAIASGDDAAFQKAAATLESSLGKVEKHGTERINKLGRGGAHIIGGAGHFLPGGQLWAMPAGAAFNVAVHGIDEGTSANGKQYTVGKGIKDAVVGAGSAGVAIVTTEFMATNGVNTLPKAAAVYGAVASTETYISTSG